MEVIKRNGKKEEFKFDKIKKRILAKADGLSVDVDTIAQKVISGMYDGVKTTELDELIAETSAVKAVDHPDYTTLASRIAVSALHKETSTFKNTVIKLYNNKDPKTGEKAPLVSEELYSIVMSDSQFFENIINKELDYSYDYFGFKTLCRSYLLRSEGKIIETPQYMLMRVSIGIHGADYENIEKTYNLLSGGYFTHATPTLFNAGTPRPQMSSCFLVDNKGDSLEELFDTMKNVASISKWSGGIGLSVHNVRAKGSYIKGTGGESDGLVPMLKTYNDVARWINQCFHPDTIIYTGEGIKNISKLTKNDIVLTLDGTYCEVGEVFKYEQKGKMLSIETKSTKKPIIVTDEHPFFVLQNKYSRIGRSIKEYENQINKGISTPSWIDSKDIKIGDFIGASIPKQVVDIDMSIDDCFFYGLMLGDGHISGNEAGISFNSETNNDEITFVMAYLDILGVKYWKTSSNKYLQIRFSLSKVKWLSKDLLYDDSGIKRMHSTLRHLPKEKAIMVIVGLLKSDGGCYRDSEIHFYNTSEKLIEDLSYQVLRFGCPTYGSWVKRKNSSKYMLDNGCKKEYTTSCDLRIPLFKELAEQLGKKEVSKKNWIIHNGILYTRVKKISRIDDYDGYVYDLKIKDQYNDPSYNISGALVHNGGKRKGSFAIYIEPWHADIFDFLDLKKNHGKEEQRARDLFYGLWIPDLFMKRVESSGDWTLMCPNECPGLHEVYGEEFDALYEKYEAEGKGRKTIKAQELWFKILESQIETGTPYMLYKDAANKKSNQKNLGTIKSSNLCTEIIEYTDPNEIAVCNLASLALPKFVTKDGTFDFDKLYEVTYQATVNLNRVIDRNFYPTPETERSNMRHRPIGLGVQGLADAFILMRYAFDTEHARKLNRDIFETIYYAALTASHDLAVKHGSYDTFEGSPASEGLLQFDLWGVEPSDRYDWAELKRKIMHYGLRNSLLLAPMPTASTAQILGNNEAFEPYTSNLYTRRVLAGEFIMVNKHLINDLINLGLWNEGMKQKLMVNNGSVINIPEIPTDIKELYRTVWEIPQKAIIDMSADRGAFICQSQSLNIFMENANFGKLTSMHFYGWKKGLKTGMYYLRTKAATDAIKFTVQKAEEQISCSLDNPEGCESCSG